MVMAVQCDNLDVAASRALETMKGEGQALVMDPLAADLAGPEAMARAQQVSRWLCTSLSWHSESIISMYIQQTIQNTWHLLACAQPASIGKRHIYRICVPAVLCVVLVQLPQPGPA
jgi:hypothetical protein